MAERDGEPFFLAPFVDEPSYLPQAMEKLVEVAAFIGGVNKIGGVYVPIKAEIEAAFPVSITGMLMDAIEKRLAAK